MEKQSLDFIKEHSVAVLSTCSDGEPHGVPVYYLFVEEQNKFYFLTKDSTRKYNNLQKNSKAFLSIYDENPQAVFTADCDVHLIDRQGNFEEILSKLVDIHGEQAHQPTPASIQKEGSLRLVELTISKDRYVSYKLSV